jgi:hypothetical protein
MFCWIYGKSNMDSLFSLYSYQFFSHFGPSTSGQAPALSCDGVQNFAELQCVRGLGQNTIENYLNLEFLIWFFNSAQNTTTLRLCSTELLCN